MERRGRVEASGLLLCCLLVGPLVAQVRHPLPVLWVMPVGLNLTAAVAPAVSLALQDLQRQPPPLGNYELQLQLLDSQCDPAQSLKVVFDAMWAGPRYLLLLGGVCPSVTALIARALPALNLVQVTFEATPPGLSNRKLYGNLFSTVPSDRAVNQATVKLLQRYRWTRVGILTQEGPRLSEMKKDLMRQLQRADIHVVSAQSLSEDVCSSVRRLKDSDARIIVGQFEGDSASEVFCCAHRLNLFGRRYQWLVADGGAARWRLRRQVSGCAADSLLAAADGSIRLQLRQLGNTNTPGVSGRTPQDYLDSYRQALTQEGSEVTHLHAFAYDAVWVAAKALSQVMEAVKHREKYSGRRNGSASEVEVQRTLLEAVRQTGFEGVTGPVSFRNGERVTSVDVIQSQGSSGVLVGDFLTSSQQLRLMTHLLRFTGAGPPRDRTLVQVRRQRVGFVLHAVVSAAAAATAIAVLLAAISRRLRLPVSGSQDLLLLLAVLLSSSSVLISGLDEASLSHRTSEVLCSVRLWTLSVGHTVGFAALFAKSWRVCSPCGATQQQQCVLLWMFLLDVFVLASWQILDPLRRVELHHSSQWDPGEDVSVQLVSECCSSSNMELWLTAVCGYKAPLLGLGCFVAWNISRRRLTLTLSMFAVAAFSASGAAGSLLTSHNPPVQFCLSSAAVLCCDVCVLSCLFGPKVLSVWLDGGELQEDAAEGGGEELLGRLNQQLRSRTAQLDVQIETITRQLCESADPGQTDAGESTAATTAHVVQVSAGFRNSQSPDGINSPEHVRRRLSVQLPILHHSYLPVVGGVSASSSSLFDDIAAQPIRRQL